MASTYKNQVRLKTFEVGYKGYYYEHDEWFTDYVEAEDEEDGLQRFYNEHFIKQECELCGYTKDICQSPETQKGHPHEFEPPPIGHFYNWKWEEGDWFMAFRYIKEVKMKPGPQCKGSGKIALDVGRK